jgi:O-antigen/teichoic acid export membrane protein
MNFLDIEIKEIGYYSAAFKILEFFLLLGTPISLIIFHRYRLFRDLTSKINLDTLYYLIGLVAFGIFISLTIFFNSEAIVKFVYGNEYLDSSAHVKIFSIALVFLLPKILLIQFLLAQEEELIVIIILGIAVVLKILFIILTFDQLSVLSISLSLLFTEFFVSTMMFLRFNSILKSKPKKNSSDILII